MKHEDQLIHLFCTVDDFCKSFEPEWKKIILEYSQKQKIKKTTRFPSLSISELITILVHFHQSGYRTFKQYYLFYVVDRLKKYFPNLLSYSRIVQLTHTVIFPIFCFLQSILGDCTGISLKKRISGECKQQIEEWKSDRAPST